MFQFPTDAAPVSLETIPTMMVKRDCKHRSYGARGGTQKSKRESREGRVGLGGNIKEGLDRLTVGKLRKGRKRTRLQLKRYLFQILFNDFFIQGKFLART